MYSRNIKLYDNKSYLILGPRGTGKSTWLRSNYPESEYINLLRSQTYNELLANPDRLETYITKADKIILIDEIQKVPSLLDTVHRLIEEKKYTFILTGSSARKLKTKGANLLAGRAYSKNFYPLTVLEVQDDFKLDFNLQYGFLPAIYQEPNPKEYLKTYVKTYLKEEVQQEGLTRNLANFARFLESASLSQGSPLNITNVAQDCSLERKLVSNYFEILEDLLIAYRLPVFSKKARRKVIKRPKFYFFDCGVFQAIRPRGVLDSQAEIEGQALETLVLQQLLAINENQQLEYQLSYWQTREGIEVDIILYGPNGFIAIEVKRSNKIRKQDLQGLKLFSKEYPEAKKIILYLGEEERLEQDIQILPVEIFLKRCLEFL